MIRKRVFLRHDTQAPISSINSTNSTKQILYVTSVNQFTFSLNGLLWFRCGLAWLGLVWFCFFRFNSVIFSFVFVFVCVFISFNIIRWHQNDRLCLSTDIFRYNIHLHFMCLQFDFRISIVNFVHIFFFSFSARNDVSIFLFHAKFSKRIKNPWNSNKLHQFCNLVFCFSFSSFNQLNAS